jgi:hypothetical protein
VRLDSLTHGIVETPVFNNPFTRFHESIEQNPHCMEDIDDFSMFEYDNWERFKKFDLKEGTYAGDTIAIPMEDNDTKLYFYDTYGESVFTSPPDNNIPHIDHRLEEDHIWAW